MPEVVLVYLAAPVGAPDAAGVEANLGAVRRWLKYLIDLPDTTGLIGRISWCAPWVPYVETLGDHVRDYRARGLRDTIAVLERCDAIATLGRETPGVRLELDHGEVRQLPVARLGGALHGPPLINDARWWEKPDHREVITELQRLVRAVDKRRAGAERPSA
jgi:hypothetical protein